MERDRIGKQRRHDFARKVEIPPSPACRRDMILRLTKEIEAIGIKHIGDNPAHWRDQRSRKALEIKINLRAEILEMLRAQKPDWYETLSINIEEGYVWQG